MSSYGRRPSYVQASFFNNRLYPHVDPSAEPAPPSPSALGATPEGTETGEPVQVPPPLYFKSRTSNSTRRPAPSTNAAQTITAKLHWESHPVLGSEWVRPRIWYHVLFRRRIEELSSRWPEDWTDPKGRPSTSSDGLRRTATGHSVHSSVDSAIGLSSLRPSKSHPLQPLFAAHISTLNTDVIPKQLHWTRVVMVLLEICNITFLILLVVALAVTRGKQTPFLQGVEVLLVMLILLNAGGYNMVRVRFFIFRLLFNRQHADILLQLKRWALVRELRSLSRDWSPLPMTSSTNQGLMGNYLGEPEDVPVDTGNKATLRWNMREYEVSLFVSHLHESGAFLWTVTP